MVPGTKAPSLLPDATPAAAPIPVLTPAPIAPASDAAVAPAAAQPQLHSVTADLQGANMTGALPPETHPQLQTEGEQLPAVSAQAAPSLISALTQVGGPTPAGPTVTPMLGGTAGEDGHVFMPPLSAELQAELASSASSSFNGIATFGIMQQQLSSTFDSSAALVGDLAADMLSSPRFAVTEMEMDGGSGGGSAAGFSAAEEAAAAASVAAVNATVSNQLSPGMNTAAFNADAGRLTSLLSVHAPMNLSHFYTSC